jgi:hypothetical protein
MKVVIVNNNTLVRSTHHILSPNLPRPPSEEGLLALHQSQIRAVEHHIERPDGSALRPDGPRSEQSAPVGRTVRACAE